MGTLPLSPLGKATVYADRYDAALLYPVERAPQRDELGIGTLLPFAGQDRWTAWEVFWLDPQGGARAGVATFDVPCTSPRIVESKSVKLWLVSMNAARFAAPDDVRETMVRELSAATGAPVAVDLMLPEAWHRLARSDPAGRCIDTGAARNLPERPDASVLACVPGARVAGETLVSHAFRSVCPVTGQPDYATLRVDYDGARLDALALSAYLAGFRRHPGFHEACVERIFVDIARACAPTRLVVEARFTRRGGLDINPLRATPGALPVHALPTLRQ